MLPRDTFTSSLSDTYTFGFTGHLCRASIFLRNNSNQVFYNRNIQHSYLHSVVMTFDLHMVDVFSNFGRCPITFNLPVDPSKTVKFSLYFIYSFMQLILLSFSFFSAISHSNVLSLKLTATEDKPFPLVAMEQNHDHDNSLDKKLMARVANEHREKSNKCNMCDYASFHAGNLRTHLKTNSGEKSNKCNQCDYTSSYPSALKTHLKMHNGEK